MSPASARTYLANLTFWSRGRRAIWLAYRRQREDVEGDVRRVGQREYARVMEALHKGEWESLEPTNEMRSIKTQIGVLEFEIEKVKQGHGRFGESQAELTALAQRLREHVLHLDFMRRMNMSQARLPGSAGGQLWPTLFQLFTSKGFAEDTSRFAKACSYIGTVLLCGGLLGIAAPAVNATIAERLDSLSGPTGQEESRGSGEKLAGRQSVCAPTDTANRDRYPTAEPASGARIFERIREFRAVAFARIEKSKPRD